MSMYQTIFNLPKFEKIKKEGYGYCIENPIKVFNVIGLHNYLANLRHKEGDLQQYTRVGSHYDQNSGHMVDQYAIFVSIDKSQNFYYVYDIFIDIYNGKDDTSSPEDFSLVK